MVNKFSVVISVYRRNAKRLKSLNDCLIVY